MIVNFLWSIALLISLAKQVSSLSCLELKKANELTCLESDKNNYVQCVKLRMKRHQRECESEEDCLDCDCESCSYSQCGGECEQCCHSCCPNYVQCHSNHCCHKQCHAECRTYNCRSSCRKSCYQTVEREKQIEEITKERVVERIIQPGGGGSQEVNNQANNTNVHNITTIINLKNVLNNTNFLDVPINLTYTNRNNITLREAQQVLRGGGSEDSCCIVIGPRQCVPIQVSPYTRCFHTRSKQCGSYCSASIVHEESRQICSSVDSFGQPTNCQQQKAYIPQPQPRCTYTSTWPYVACGIQPPAACEGCYGHYFNSHQVKQFKSCSPQCYDDFSMGPLYRQGPVYQPGFSQALPCAYSPQGCWGGFGGGMGGGFAGGMGGFAGDMGGMGMSPSGFGGYGHQFPGAYGYGQGYGGPFGYGLPLSGYPPQPDGSFPYFGSSFNITTSNNTLLNITDLLEPQYDNWSFVPLNPGSPGKEVEIDVAITKPEEVPPPAKRGIRHHHVRGKEFSVETV